HLDISLFQRHARGLALTTAGAAYLVNVSRAFDTLTESTNQLLVQPQMVTISVTPTVAAKLLITRLAELHAAIPGVELRSIATESLSAFDHDQVDLARRLTDLPFPAGLEAKRLFRQELVAVASPHLVRHMKLPLTMDQLCKRPLLHDAHDHWPTILPANAGLAGAVFNQTTLALDAALAGQGVALACRAFVAADIEAGRLLQVIKKAPIMGPSFFLVRKRALSSRKSVIAIWDWCAEQLTSN